ncbi:MAG: McrC family protein [Prochlorothrix sp.]
MTPFSLDLIEYKPVRVPAQQISTDLGEKLWKTCETCGISLEFPSPKNRNHWELTSQGRIGRISVSPELSLNLRPKVPIQNLFRMVEYAYNLNNLRFLEGITSVESLEDFYQTLAQILAKNILDRTRKGLYHSYREHHDRRTTLRGRLDLDRHLRQPWTPALPCRYPHLTPDLPHNQILLWTLHQIRRHSILQQLPHSPAAATVRQAYRALHGSISLIPHTAHHCTQLPYDRLNQDYQPLHALCRFFLEQTGPSLNPGDRQMLPFLINMNELFEKFIAQWLQDKLKNPAKLDLPDLESHLGSLSLTFQPKKQLSPDHSIRPDLMLSDRATQTPRLVLDTKYKTPNQAKDITKADLYQAIAYATALNLSTACLIYPQPLSPPLALPVNSLQIHSLTFSLDGDLEANGKAFLQQLFSLPF